MKALVKTATGPGNLELCEREKPGDPPSGYAVLQVVAAGICGTDLHIYDDEYVSCPPVIMGHEVGGVVTRIGEGVPTDVVGCRVATETYFSTCTSCDWCRAGRPNLCPRRQSIGSHVDGGFAEFVTVPAHNLHPVPQSLPDAAVPLMEPLACVCQCLCDPPVVGVGDDVLVVGAGTMGIIAAQVAAAAGGSVVVVGLAQDAPRLKVAASLGLKTFVTKNGDDLSQYAPGGAGFDVVIDCSGSEGGINAGIAAARRGARYVQIGLAGRRIGLHIDEVCYRELTLTSGFASTPVSWARATRLAERGLVALAPLVSEVVPLAKWQYAFDQTRHGRGVKFVFDPRL